MRKKIKQICYTYLSISKLLLLGILLITQIVLVGQTRSFYEHGHRIEHFTEKDGLQSFHVGGIAQDKDGYLWIGTSSGFLRFDGYEMKRFNISDDLITNTVQDHLSEIFIDKDSILWITTLGGGVIRYDVEANTFERFLTNKPEQDEAFSICQDSIGNIWYGSMGGLLKIDQDKELTSFRMKQIGNHLNPVIDSLKKQSPFYKEILEADESGDKKIDFKLEESTQISIICSGRIDEYGKFLDYGWLENQNGEKIWEVELEKSMNTGGEFMTNRTNVDFLNLEKGNYTLYFKKSEQASRNFYRGKFYGENIKKPEWEGIKIFAINKKEQVTIKSIVTDYENESALLSDTDLGVFKDKEGNVWCYSYAFPQFGKLDLEKGTIGKSLTCDPLNIDNHCPDYIENITTVGDYTENVLWLGGQRKNNKGVYVSIFDKETNAFQEMKTGLPTYSPRAYIVSHLQMDSAGDLWIGTVMHGLFKLSPPFIKKGEEGIPNIVHFYFGYDENFSGKYGNPRNVYCQYIDTNQNLWIGTQVGGMYKIDLKKPNFHLVYLDTIIGEDRFLNMEEDIEGNVWIGTRRKGLIQYDSKTNKITRYENNFKGENFEKPIAPILALKNDNILFGTNKYLIEYNPRNDRVIRKILRPYRGWGPMFYEGFTIDDSLAFLVPNYIFDTKNLTLNKPISDLLKGKYFNSGIKSHQNGFWLAGNYGSVIKLAIQDNGLDTLELFDSQTYIDDIIESPSGNPWITSGYGLQLFEKDSLLPTTYNKIGEEVINISGSTLLDNNSDIWTFTLSGITKFELKEKKIVKIPRLDEIEIVTVPNNYVIKNGKGEFRVLGAQGLYTFYPDSLPIDPVPPSLKIEFLSFNEENEVKQIKTFEKETLINFEYKQNDLTLKYVGINFNNSEQIIYAYQMEGLNNDWQQVGKERTARFLDLPAGNYIFKVKAANADGVWSEPKSLKITILPPWWKTWWAYLIYAFSIIGLLAYWYQSLQQKIKNKEAQLAKEKAFSSKLERINVANQRFVPNNFLQILGKESIEDLKLGDQTQTKMTVLFSDIRDYTPLSESMTPEENFQFINIYLGRVGPIIKAHGGFISTYLGDGFMALFINEPKNALQASIAIQKELDNYNRERKTTGKRWLKTGMGLNTGELMLGVIGDEHRYESTVISDAVNTASRMEGLTKVFGAAIILSEKTLLGLNVSDTSKVSDTWGVESGSLSKNVSDTSKVSDKFAYRYLGKVKVKGKDRALKIYDLYEGETVAIRELKAQTKLQFEQGISQYYNREFGKAAECFKQVLTVNETDKAAQYYLDKSVQFIVNGVTADWSGVEEMVMK